MIEEVVKRQTVLAMCVMNLTSLVVDEMG
jgi:hypothetical protein